MDVPSQNMDESRQLFLDRPMGSVHIDSFEELNAWSKANIDPLERSNTPLLPRTSRRGTDKGKSKIMLIHDYEGGYLEYEAGQGTTVASEKYACEYLQFVEVFVYFSHKLVTVPPPTWTNTCHRNGVKVLGTFIVEPDTSQIERMFERVDGRFTLADRLACMADEYGFDGWLINVERPFPPLYWRRSLMEAFLTQLRLDMGPNRKVVWYDALITLNLVWYQNTLNYLNLSFALAAGAILTNYAWNPSLARKAKELAKRSGLGIENLYFGIDAWAQNTHEGKNPRVTYPPGIGGGTGIGLSLQELANIGINAGIFAPGWSFEHFQGQNYKIEQAVWLGNEMDSTLSCDCTPVPLHLTVPYQEHPIVRYAQSYPAGSKSFVYTDFKRAFERRLQSDGGLRLYAHLGDQSMLPPMSRAVFQPWDHLNPASLTTELYAKLEDCPARCSISTCGGLFPADSEQLQAVARLHLFDLEISDTRIMEVEVTYRKAETTDIILKLAMSEVAEIEIPEKAQKDSTMSKLFDGTASRPLRTFDLIIMGRLEEIDRLRENFIEFTSLKIRPHSSPMPDLKLHDLHIERRTDLSMVSYRLTWEISANPDQRIDGLPYSAITGPFAFFRIYMDDEEIGKAYALEFELPCDAISDPKTPKDVRFEVVGVSFDGTVTARAQQRLLWPSSIDEDWVVVNHGPENLC